jgi:hypothetical protein
MSEKLLLVLCAVMLACSAAFQANAQNRKSVSAAEVNGTFRDYFGGKFKGNYNEIKILALGKGKVKVSFGLTYPYIDGTGGMTANVGEAAGEASINGDTAIYTNEEFGECKITIKFVRPGIIKVDQSGADSQCGFGFNVSASGTYKKTSKSKPQFNE